MIPESELRHAIDRIGETPLGRMRWVLNFLSPDFNDLSEGELLNLRYDFLALHKVPLEWRGRDGSKRSWRQVGAGRSLTIEELRRVHNDWRALLDRFLQAKVVGAEFIVQPHTVRVVRRTDDGFTSVLRTIEDRPMSGLLLDLLTDFGHRIRKCEECPQLYVAVRQRQRFCSRRCQNRVSFREKQKRDAQAQALAPAIAMGPTEAARQQNEESPRRRRHAGRVGSRRHQRVRRAPTRA